MVEQNNYTDKWLFFLLGGIIGSAITFLMSPTSGRETRQLLTSKAREGKEMLDTKLRRGMETYHEGKEQVKSQAKEFEEKLRGVVEEKKSELEEEISPGYNR